jgi:uncharacterized protein involved in exopolysaccharide biosynthesis
MRSETASSHHPDEIDEIDVQRWTRVLLRGWILLLLGVVAGAAFGWFAASRAPRFYEATATVALTPPPDPAGVFNAPGLREAVISQSIAAALHTELRATGRFDGTLQDVLGAMTIEPVINTPMFHIKARLTDAQLAATAATRAGELAVIYMTSQWQEVSARALQRLGEQRGRARLALTEAEDATRSDQLLEREVRRKVYIDVAARHEQARLEFESGAPPLRIVHAAAVPDRAIPTSPRRTIALGALAGLTLAACVVILREWRTAPVAPAPARV